MNYTKTTPCSDCPFLTGTEHAYTDERLAEFASGVFPCHKTAKIENNEFQATKESQHCAGALIYNEKREQSNQMMRIAERLGLYDHSKLNMEASVR
jgi:hypothetical protein